MEDLREEVKKNISNIAEALKRTGTAQVNIAKDGLKVTAVSKHIVSDRR